MNNSEYVTLEGFGRLSCMGIATATGGFNRYGNFEINMSEIYSALIVEAAKNENYASDLIILLDGLKERIAEASFDYQAFGFRRNGVDGNNLVASRFQNAHFGTESIIITLSRIYRSLYFIKAGETDEYGRKEVTLWKCLLY